MRKLTLLVMLLLTASQQVYSQWVNGQNASYVIGNTDFTTVGTISSSGLAVDITNNKLYSVDYCKHVVYRYSLPISANNPTPERIFGILNDFGTTQNKLHRPVSVAVNDNGRLYVSDGANNRILYWNNAHSIGSDSQNADGVIGQTDYVTNTSGTTDSKFNFYVSASNLYSCGGVTYGGYIYAYSNHLFVSDGGNNRVLRIDNDNSASVVYGQTNMTDNSTGRTITTLDKPMGVTVAKSYLYVVDMNNNRILRFNSAVTNNTNGSNADAVYGQTSYTDALSGRTSILFNSPIGLTIDGKDRLYITDSNNGRVVTIDNANTTDHSTLQTSFSNVLGQSDFTSYYGTTITQENLYAGVTGIAVDIKNNKLYVGNSGASRILVYNASSALPLTLTNIYQLNNEINYKNNSYTISDISLEVSEDGISYIIYNANSVGYGKHKFDISNLSSIYKYYRLKQVNETGQFYSTVYSFDSNKKYYYHDGYLDISTNDISATYTVYDVNGIELSKQYDTSNQTIDFKKLYPYSNILFIRLNIFDNSNNVNYLVSDKIVTE